MQENLKLVERFQSLMDEIHEGISVVIENDVLTNYHHNCTLYKYMITLKLTRDTEKFGLYVTHFR